MERIRKNANEKIDIAKSNEVTIQRLIENTAKESEDVKDGQNLTSSESKI